MSEERNAGELPEARTSSFKMVLGAAGIVIGLGVLFCGGVAGFVAWKGPSGKEAETDPAPPPPDREDIRTTARKIAKFDLPAGFEPLRNGSSPPVLVVAFGRPDVPAAVLTIGRIEKSSIPAGSSPETQTEMMLQMLQREGGTTNSMLRRTDSTTTRELTVLGQPASFKIMQGTAGPSEIRAVKVTGSFRTEAALIALSYTIPEEDFDEEAVVKMIESIMPAPGDSAPKVSP